MRTGIEQARLELAKWEAIAAQDRDALNAAEQHVRLLRNQVERSAETARGLKGAVDRWDAMHAAPVADCGEAGHDQGKCGNAACLGA